MTKPTFRSVQALRGVAALLIVMHHYNEVFPYAVKAHIGSLPSLLTWGHMTIIGAIGVPIFFIISGFVMGLQPESSGWRGASNFMMRRIIRIVPLYWLLTLAVAAWITHVDPPLLLRSLFFVAHHPPQYPVIGPGWTLEYEMLFYLGFAAFAASGIFRTQNRGLVALACVMALCVAFNLVGYSFFWKIGDPIIFEFCAGLVISRIYKIREISSMWPLYLLLGATFILLSVPPSVTSWPLLKALWGAGAFCIVLGVVCAEARQYTFGTNRIFQSLGDASYAIYLVHVPLRSLTFKSVFWKPHLSQHLDSNIALAILVAYAAIVGLLLHRLLERPLLAGMRSIPHVRGKVAHVTALDLRAAARQMPGLFQNKLLQAWRMMKPQQIHAPSRIEGLDMRTKNAAALIAANTEDSREKRQAA
jgi:exopolysaccharide production protein ExoZ